MRFGLIGILTLVTLALLAAPVARVTVLIVDDAHMRDLHQRYHGSAETTDVLTFPASKPGEMIEADIAVQLVNVPPSHR